MTGNGFVRTALARLAEIADTDPSRYAEARNNILASAGQEIGDGTDIQEVSDAIPDDIEQFRRATQPPGTIRIPGITMHPLPLP